MYTLMPSHALTLSPYTPSYTTLHAPDTLTCPLSHARPTLSYTQALSHPPVLRLSVQAALGWLQLPQQDADNVEEKSKIHLEIEGKN